VAGDKAGTEARLYLDQPSLRMEGWVAGLADFTVRNGAPSPWAFDTFWAGTTLENEDGTAHWRVSGASGGWWSAPTGTTLRLDPALGDAGKADVLRAKLRDVDGNGEIGFRVYEYGPGDEVEIAACVDWRAKGAVTHTPGVRVVGP
jgi:hypothetical protein